MSGLLEILADGEAKTAQKLTALSGLDKTALTEEIQRLRSQGLQIERHGGKIRLIPQLQRLDYTYLSKALTPYQVFVKPVLDSTNQYLLDRITRLNKGDLCLAEHQTAGRGRRGRQWLSPFAGQVIMSFYWMLEPRKSVEGLSLVIGMAIADALKQAGAPGIFLKWPNDVLLNGRKLAGILVEIANVKNGLLNLVVGIGLNLSLPERENHIDQPWAQLIDVLPGLDRNRLIVQMVKRLYTHLDRFEQAGIDAGFRQKWLESDYFFDQQVNVITENRIVTGIERGIDEKGYLLVAVDDGQALLRFNGGEVSLRKK